MIRRTTFRFKAAAALLLALSGMAVAPADARRGGSFGSRGARTYYAPRSTSASSPAVAPIERSMTPRSASQTSPGVLPGFGSAQPYRPAGSRFGGFGGGLIGGLVAGGLIGHFLGNGMSGGWGSGGGGGLLASLIQIAILGGIVWLVIGLFRRRSGVAAGQAFDAPASIASPPASGPWGGPAMPAQGPDDSVDIALDPRDQQDFERLLIAVQDAFGREDYARLRTLTTPEIMSYLSEELSRNATQGLRNEVSGTRLIDAEVSEAWREAGGDYATIVLRYEGIDLMRNRATGAIVSGSASVPSETTEFWTFVRGPDNMWRLSAIQER
ncbi:MAG TPA: TIM44-like domain-containing protein [Sphingomonas sp.]